MKIYLILPLAAAIVFGCSPKHYAVREESQDTGKHIDTKILESNSKALEDSVARAAELSGSLQDTLLSVIDESLTDDSPVPVVKGNAESILAYAKEFLGRPYHLGASGPDQFDCSGFIWYVFKHEGYELTRLSAKQFTEGCPVEDFGDLEKGDLVFFGGRRNVRVVGHVGIVTDIDYKSGSFRFIHASTSNGVEIQKSTHPYFMMRYIGARRIIGCVP